MSKTITGSLLMLVTLSLPTSAVLAQQGDEPRACANDIRAQCAGVIPGEGRIRACIKEHFKELSEPCQIALLKAAAINQACESDVKRNCADTTSNAGAIAACMQTHLGSVSDFCKDTLSGFATDGN